MLVDTQTDNSRFKRLARNSQLGSRARWAANSALANGQQVTISNALDPNADGTWLGKVTDPRDGATYDAKLWRDATGDLHLRGYIGIPLLGATQTWRPFTGHLTAECGFA